MQIDEFLKNFSKDINIELPEMKQVLSQATSHYIRDGYEEKLKAKRPNEADHILDWRVKNMRQISKGILQKIEDNCGYIFTNPGFSIDKGSDKLKEHISKYKTYYLGQEVDFWQFLWKCVLQETFKDANGFICPIPYHPKDESIAPDKMDASQAVKIKDTLISSSQLKWIDNDIIVFLFKQIEVTNHGLINCYLAGDKRYWYLLKPIVDNSQIKYVKELWYDHRTGSIPATIFAGNLTKNKKGLQYQESLLHFIFEFLDEFISQFSTDQVMNVVSGHPILVAPELNCGTCAGTGRVQSGDKAVKCSSCHGTGLQSRPSEAQQYTVKGGNSLEQGAVMNPYYLSVDVGALAHSDQRTWSLLDRITDTIGLDPILPKNSEGEQALMARFHKLETFLTSIKNSFKQFIESHLKNVEALLVPITPEEFEASNFEKRKDVNLKCPAIIKLKSEQALTTLFNNSTFVDRINTAIELQRCKNGDDIREYEIAIKYFPILVMKDKEISERTNLRIITDEQVKQIPFIITAFQQLKKDIGEKFNELDESEIVSKAKVLINELAQ